MKQLVERTTKREARKAHRSAWHGTTPAEPGGLELWLACGHSVFLARKRSFNDPLHDCKQCEEEVSLYPYGTTVGPGQLVRGLEFFIFTCARRYGTLADRALTLFEESLKTTPWSKVHMIIATEFLSSFVKEGLILAEKLRPLIHKNEPAAQQQIRKEIHDYGVKFPWKVLRGDQ